MRTIAVGDIHGCRASLEALADAADFAGSDLIVTLGDYVDRGPDSKGAIDFLLKLREERPLVALMGNHEVFMLEARKTRSVLRNWLSEGVGGDTTMDSYGAEKLADIPEEHWKFIEKTKLYHEIETHFFVHAMVLPDVPLADQPEEVLLWDRFDYPRPHQSGKTMVCGHTSQKDGVPVNRGHAICIDTCAYGGGWLTALEIETGHYWQTNEAGQRREGEIGDLLE